MILRRAKGTIFVAKNKILMVAFHFPPFSGSSGVQRTLRFCQYLPISDWLPLVLSANSRAYEKTSNELLSEIPSSVEVRRVFALDSARHLSIFGRHSSLLATPDRWISWAIAAIPSGYFFIKKHRPKLIWSTYPLATTHLIAYSLHKLTKIPWVADFRDPMVEKDPRDGQWMPSNKLVRRARLYIEKKAVNNASRLIFCTEGARRICMERYPNIDTRKLFVIPNGFDEGTFREAEEDSAYYKNDTPITLLHSGFLYNSPDRDPSHFFEAISLLKSEGKISGKTFRVLLRACGYENEYRTISEQKNISDIILIEPAIQYKEAIREMMAVDGLLIFQGYTSNPAIPAKIYEYLRAKRPIFALADKDGDTAEFLLSIGVDDIAPLDDTQQIKNKLELFLKKISRNLINKIPDEIIMLYSRENETKRLASIFDGIIKDGAR